MVQHLFHAACLHPIGGVHQPILSTKSLETILSDQKGQNPLKSAWSNDLPQPSQQRVFLPPAPLLKKGLLYNRDQNAVLG